jgi:hypothetical protein
MTMAYLALVVFLCSCLYNQQTDACLFHSKVISLHAFRNVTGHVKTVILYVVKLYLYHTLWQGNLSETRVCFKIQILKHKRHVYEAYMVYY